MTRGQQPLHQSSPLPAGLSLPSGGAVPSRENVVTEEIFNAIARIEANPLEGRTVARMLKVAERTLETVGFNSRAEILRGKTESFCTRVPAGYEMATAVALEALAWHRLRHSSDTYYAAVLYLERAAKLSPLDTQIVGRWGELVVALKPEQVVVPASKPDRPGDIVLLNLQLAKRGIENLLQNQYSIAGPLLMGIERGALTRHLTQYPEHSTMTVFHLAGIDVDLSLQIGISLRSRPMLHFATNVAHSRLELLGYPRPVPHQLDAILADARSLPKSERFLKSEDLLFDALSKVHECAHFFATLAKDTYQLTTVNRVRGILKVLRPDTDKHLNR